MPMNPKSLALTTPMTGTLVYTNIFCIHTSGSQSVCCPHKRHLEMSGDVSGIMTERVGVIDILLGRVPKCCGILYNAQESPTQ